MSLKSLVSDLKKDGRRDREISRAAAQKLGEIGDSSVIRDLEDARDNHKDKETANLAKDAIAKIKKRESKGKQADAPARSDSSSQSSSYEITSAKEVTKASEDGLLLILEETQEGTINRDGTTVKDEKTGKMKVDAKGVLKAKNNGETDRIWDIDIKVRDKGLSGLDAENYHINELDPQEEWTQEYDITDLPESLPLQFKEIINTVGTDEPSNILVFGQTMETTLSYEIQAEKKLNDVDLSKDFPDHFSEARVISASLGKAGIDGGKLTWQIPELKENETATLQINCKIKVEDSTPKRSGEAKIKFTSKVEGAFSSVDVEGADGLVRNFSYVEADEIDDQPDNWNCKLVLENPSEFPIELRDVLIKKGEYVFVSEEYEASDNVIIQSKGTWESKQFTLFSEEIPSFEKNVTFTVKPEIMYLATSALSVLDTELRVANLRATKQYGVETIPSFRQTPIPTTIEFSNIGSLGFSSVTIKDVIPPKFSTDAEETFKLFINDEEVSGSEYDISYDSGASVKVPDDAEVPEKETGSFDDSKFPERTLVLKINRLIEPEQTVKLEYTPIAMLPEPDRKFSGQAEIIAELAEPGPPLDIFVSDWLSTQLINVVHQRKAIRRGKMVIPSSEAGLYDIELTFVNKGDAPLQNVMVRDLIPEGFKLLNDAFSDMAEDKSDPKGKIRTWTFESVEKDQTITITYSLQGQGDDFHVKMLQQTIT
jgi:hypothetical protein